MAEDSLRLGGLSSGLALLLDGDDKKDGSSSKGYLVSSYEEFGDQSVERTIEHIFDLPYKSIGPLPTPIDVCLIHSIMKKDFLRFHADINAPSGDRDGICIFDTGYGTAAVGFDESSISGDLRITKSPLLVESFAMFSSARANTYVCKGKWMYEAILATSGIQQLGWATPSCPFTDHKGVGDADDSYAFDGKRVSKWNIEAEPYGQPWVVGDVIGCCIDLDHDTISFYRNGISLGNAFCGLRRMGPGSGYHPAVSLSQGERCEFNFGALPFRYPIDGFSPFQVPPSTNSLGTKLLRCLSRLMEIQCMDRVDFSSLNKLRRLKRFAPVDELFRPVSHGICKEFISVVEGEVGSAEYIGRGLLLSFMIEIFGLQTPHDYRSLDKVIDIFLEFEESHRLLQHVLSSLSLCCKTSPLILTECPNTGSYSYLALACHILRREELMLLWLKSPDFDLQFEGFLSRKSPNKQDLQCIMPSVWWPGSSEDVSYESSMVLTTTALSEAICKIEEKQRELCCLVIQVTSPTATSESSGSVFRTFLQNVLFKNQGADRNVPPPGVSCNSVLVSLYTVVLHFLSEGYSSGVISGLMKGCTSDAGTDIGFLHRGGEQSFPVSLILTSVADRVDISRLGGSFSHLSKSHPVNDQEVERVHWEEGSMDDEESRVTHSTRIKPCCCSSYDPSFSRISKSLLRYSNKNSRGHCSPGPERSTHVAADCSASSLHVDIADKPSSSNNSGSEFSYQTVHNMKQVLKESNLSSTRLREEELLDALLLLYQLGLAPNYRQASYYMSHQSQSISLLEETDRQIKERACGDRLKHLKEARNLYREEVIDCVRHCAWYRISLISRWKQRGMYAMCMWTVQLLLALSKTDSIFVYVPEFYLEALVDCFHVLRKSDPPFVPSAIFVKKGLTSFVTFIVTHFNDPRISSADIRDLLLHSVSVLVQYKEFLSAFECNNAATTRMPKALLSAFDNRSWIPVTNIILRFCKGSCFGSSRHGESSTSSVLFQRLVREACIENEELFSAFLNRLFNTLSWTMTEFSASIREIQEKYEVIEFQQKKCSVIFDLSCNLAKVLEFCTYNIPQVFLSGIDTNLRRLTELIVFILNHIISVQDDEFFYLSLRRPGQNPEKVNRGMILAPIAGIILNLLDASVDAKFRGYNDLVEMFASMDCVDTFYLGFQYLLQYNWINWAKSFREGDCCGKLKQLENFSNLLFSLTQTQKLDPTAVDCKGETEGNDRTCYICYASEANAQFIPCYHQSCYGCITRHLLNCHRCFFCNATVLQVLLIDKELC